MVVNVQKCFKEHSVRCGESVVALEEEHLKEMGVVSVGHRLELIKAIEELRKECGFVSREKYVDVAYVISQ